MEIPRLSRCQIDLELNTSHREFNFHTGALKGFLDETFWIVLALGIIPSMDTKC